MKNAQIQKVSNGFMVVLTEERGGQVNQINAVFADMADMLARVAQHFTDLALPAPKVVA